MSEHFVSSGPISNAVANAFVFRQPVAALTAASTSAGNEAIPNKIIKVPGKVGPSTSSMLTAALMATASNEEAEIQKILLAKDEDEDVFDFTQEEIQEQVD